MPENAATPKPRKGLLLRLLRWLSWLLIIVALAGVAIYLAFGPARMIDRLKPPPPAFPEEVIEEPAAVAKPVAAPPPAAFAFRFGVESVRGNEVQIGGLTGPQVVLIPLIAWLAIHFARRWRSGAWRVPVPPPPVARLSSSEA